MWLPLSLALLAGAAFPEDSSYARVVGRALARAEKGVRASLTVEFDHSRWDDPWVVQSSHYEVRTTASYAQADALARGLEFVHAEFERLLGTGRAPTELARVWIVAGMGDYNRFGNDHGAEHSSMYGSFFAAAHPEKPVIAIQDPNATQLGMWVTHSALHQHLERSFGAALPVWIEEGLASYFALYWDWGYGTRELERLKRERALLGLERLVASPIGTYVGRAHERFIQLGMLFRYLLDFNESTRTPDKESLGPFQEFLRAAVRGQPLEAEEFHLTFTEAVELLEQDFSGFAFPQ